MTPRASQEATVHRPRWIAPLALLFLAGCQWPFRASSFPDAPPWVHVRAFRTTGLEPQRLGGIVVLPFRVESGLTAEDGENVRGALVLGLRERQIFHVEPVTTAQAQRASWTLDPAPGDDLVATLVSLRGEFAAQAALFGTVTYRRVYAEPALGLRLSLVDTADGRILWTADDLVDSRDPWVRSSLDTYRWLNGEPLEASAGGSALPFDQFARFVAASYVASLQPPPPPPEPAPEENKLLNKLFQ